MHIFWTAGEERKRSTKGTSKDLVKARSLGEQNEGKGAKKPRFQGGGGQKGNGGNAPSLHLNVGGLRINS